MKVLMLGAALLSIGFIMFFTDPYGKYKKTECVVLDKVQDAGGYKSSAHFYLVLRDKENYVFDLIVTPATYSQARIGQAISFDLRDFDIRQTTVNNLYVFFYVVVFSVGLSIILTKCIFRIIKH